MGNGESIYMTYLLSCIDFKDYKCDQKQQIEQISFFINLIIIILCIILIGIIGVILKNKDQYKNTLVGLLFLLFLIIFSSSLNMTLIGVQPIPPSPTIQPTTQPTTQPTIQPTTSS